MKRRDVVHKLEAAGFRILRDDGRHTIYYKPGFKPIPVPRHNELNEITARGILKDAGVK